MRKTFSATIEDYCEKRGLTRAELAHRLKISHSRMTEILKSESLTEKTVLKCAEAMGAQPKLTFVAKTVVKRQKKGKGR